MSFPGSQKLSIVLYGLDDHLASQLTQAATGPGRLLDRAHSLLQCTKACSRGEVDVIFASSERDKYLELLQALRSNRILLPVIVTSRLPEVRDWLDALDAGAADYCASPFERSHIQWILESSQRSSPVPGQSPNHTALRSVPRHPFRNPPDENFSDTHLA